MSSPQLENGYTKLANELIEQFAKINLSGREWQILFVILRKTYGFNKKEDKISLTQFEENTGIKSNDVSKIIKSLETKKIIGVDRGEWLNSHWLNKQWLNWLQPVAKQPLKVVAKQPLTKERNKYTKESIVPNGTSIIINGTTYMEQELTYEPLEGKKVASKYGRATMAILARKYAELAGIELGQCFDASEWSKPLGSMYRYFGKDADKTMEYMEKAINYFESKNLYYTPNTLARDKEMMGKWAGEDKKDISERRVL